LLQDSDGLTLRDEQLDGIVKQHGHHPKNSEDGCHLRRSCSREGAEYESIDQAVIVERICALSGNMRNV
jgi:hypothetical protein